MDIREKHGFAYDAHTETDMLKSVGTAIAVTEVRNEVVAPALEALHQDMQAIGDTKVDAVELSEAKSSYAGRFILNLERQSGRADELTRIEVLNLPSDFLDTFMTHVRSVEPDDIQKVSKQFWTPSDATVVVVGDASKIQKSLESIGTFQVIKPQQ
ncbi:MAG: insulinase family protein [Acidobacteriaceae bacterium]|nr:insulinase family protein [Acidobacteriaceae bacterium]